MANFFDFLSTVVEHQSSKPKQPQQKPKPNLRKLLALALIGGVGVITTKYKEIVADFLKDPVPFVLFPVLIVAAWFIWKFVSPKIPEDNNTNQSSSQRKNNGEDYNG